MIDLKKVLTDRVNKELENDLVEVSLSEEICGFDFSLLSSLCGKIYELNTSIEDIKNSVIPGLEEFNSSITEEKNNVNDLIESNPTVEEMESFKKELSENINDIIRTQSTAPKILEKCMDAMNIKNTFIKESFNNLKKLKKELDSTEPSLGMFSFVNDSLENEEKSINKNIGSINDEIIYAISFVDNLEGLCEENSLLGTSSFSPFNF